MPDQEYYPNTGDGYYDPSENYLHESSAGKRAMRLPFDEAWYMDGKVPCQWLASSYFLKGLNYCIKSQSGELWPVSKSSIADFMCHGLYVWVKSVEWVKPIGSIVPSLELSSQKDRTLYRPISQTMPTSLSDLKWLGPFYSQAQLKGRACVHRPDGTRGPGLNIKSIAKRAQEETSEDTRMAERMEQSALVWQQAHERARGY